MDTPHGIRPGEPANSGYNIDIITPTPRRGAVVPPQDSRSRLVNFAIFRASAYSEVKHDTLEACWQETELHAL